MAKAIGNRAASAAAECEKVLSPLTRLDFLLSLPGACAAARRPWLHSFSRYAAQNKNRSFVYNGVD
jgi:hypothetical protein